jgi:hypothetical protein
METSAYKLAEYKIIEHNTNELRWETHFGVGALKEGRCFKKGTILFIGPAENDRPGFLKLEFIDHLKRLPVWTKTKYYCFNLDVYQCRANKKVTKKEMQLWTMEHNLDKKHKINSDAPNYMVNLSTMRDSENLHFRLNRYEIIKKKDGRILWNSFIGPAIIANGDCIILEDIIFFLRPLQNKPFTIIKQNTIVLNMRCMSVGA